MNEINNFLSDINHTTVTAEQVNKLISDISSTFTSSADTVFGAREQVRRNYNNNNKPWFNKECKQKRDVHLHI
jgi:S-adenosylmethionine:diacylglycerol 3-amino-3-carboxypropyl transferase